MKPLHWIMLILFAVLVFLLSDWASARNRFGMTLSSGAHITLTDEPCNLKNPDTHQLLPGFRAFGDPGDGTGNYPACWKDLGDSVMIIWFMPDNVTPIGVSQVEKEKFSPVRTTLERNDAKHM